MIEIRPYRDEDHAATALLWLASWHSTGLAVAQKTTGATLYERIVRELASGWSAYLAWDGEKRVGFLALKPQAGCLDQLFILPETQGTGIGPLLLDFAKQQLPNGLWLRTAAENTRACRSYERNGLMRANLRGIRFWGT